MAGYLIPVTTWQTYYKTLSKVSRTAADKMLAYVQKNGYKVDHNFISYAYSLTSRYGEAAAELATEMYDFSKEYWQRTNAGERAYERMQWNPAEPAEVASYEDVAKTMNGIAKTSVNPNSFASAVGRMVKQAAEDTTLQNAARDGAEWAWVPNGDTCAFCITLASRGWQHASKKVSKGIHASHVHSNCDCTFAVRFDGKGGVPGYDPDTYLGQYYSADGRTPEEMINSMRRIDYAQNKEKINAQKRAAYALRKEASEE